MNPCVLSRFHWRRHRYLLRAIAVSLQVNSYRLRKRSKTIVEFYISTEILVTDTGMSYFSTFYKDRNYMTTYHNKHFIKEETFNPHKKKVIVFNN